MPPREVEMRSEPSIHERALCEATEIGTGTEVDAFAHVQADTHVGSYCRIGVGALIERGAVLGDRVIVGSGARIMGHVRLEDDVVVGPNATFSTESGHRVDHRHDAELLTVVRSHASIGACAVVLAGLEVGSGAAVEPGAVVVRSVPPHAVSAGNPAQIERYLSTQSPTPVTPMPVQLPDAVPMGVRSAHLHRFPEFTDFRGSLTSGEFPTELLPFVPRRWFIVYDAPSRELRGGHAHWECHQFLVCVAGSVTVAVDDGVNRAETLLDRPTLGLHIPPLVWGSQFRYESDSVLLVLASHPYTPDDYIREYDQFLGAALRQ
jgi:UDP-2-acetamido-3-amino-2,3-dideoxy-glucuronate N-acetyltransferase